MTDRNKVIEWLDFCIANTDGSICECEMSGCPYLGGSDVGNCYITLMTDTLALLKAQEPRVMTFDEIVAAAPGTVVWLEDYDKTDVIAGLVKKVYIYTKVIDFLIVNEKVNDEVTADLDAYSEGWRCWTSRPTEEQREATPWN